MHQLNLPPYPICVRQTDKRPEIYDFLRRRFVALTPEEWVRQHFTHFLISHKGYPKGLLANEVELRVGEKHLRCDSLLYNKQMQPRMIVEYKAPTINITQHVFDQICAYNLLLRADYIVVSNGLAHYCCKLEQETRNYQFLNDIPSYNEL